jgi:uncharacterized membrane protein YbhN (UPF0104 family)
MSMERGHLDLRSLLDRRALAVAGVLMLGLLAVAATPQLLGPEVRGAFGRLENAHRGWLWFAGTAFVAALVANGWAWRAAVALAGGDVARGQAVARYGIGSLVNAAAPARLGDAVRVALFSRVLPPRDRLWTAGGVFTAIGAARALCLAGLVVYSSASGVLPRWPVAVLVALVVVAVAVSVRSRRSLARTHASHLLDAFRGLGRSPAQGARVVAWIAVATACRIAGVAAVAAALGVRAPVAAAVLLVPVLDLAGLLPLTPGNLGITSGAVAMALQSHGIGLTTALSASIALHALESAASIGVGLTGALYLAQGESPSVRRWALRVGGAAACLALAGFVSVAFLDLV